LFSRFYKDTPAGNDDGKAETERNFEAQMERSLPSGKNLGGEVYIAAFVDR
jgi:hypothetical protein